MSDDFYPFVDSGDPAPSNTHLTGTVEVPRNTAAPGKTSGAADFGNAPGESRMTHTARISVYDDMLSTPRVILVEQQDVRTYLEDVTNTVYRTMKEQGGHITLMIIRELVENFIHAHFSEPIISILDNGDTIRFSDQGPGIGDKELAFEFGVTSADREQKRYIRGTGSGLPMIQQYVENAGGAIALEDNLGTGTVVTVSVDPARVREIEQSVSRGAAVRSGGQANMPNATMYQSSYQGTYGSPYSSPMPRASMPNPAPMPMAFPGVQGMPTAPGTPMAPGTPGVPMANTAPNGMYQQPTPQPYSYPQYGNQFSTIPQPYAQPAEMYSAPFGGQPVAPGAHELYVSERGMTALWFISENVSGGPTDLTRAHGNSNGTWSRELATLAKAGLVHKTGQKYVLTDMGRAWLQRTDA